MKKASRQGKVSKPASKKSAPASYDPAKIEKKWQKKWASAKTYASKESSTKDKYYVLDMFPYPSGEGLHVGHPKGYIATDVISRMKRMQGRSVLHPMGFDAFGLPAENYAIKTKTNPADSVKKNVARYKKQLEILGLDYDWSREVNTTDPDYYRWTQWIFLQLLKKDLAYESYEPVNWCPTDKTVLANEDVENGRCERCGTPVEKKPLRQWVLKITDYADRLLKDLDATDYVMPIVVDKTNPHREGMPVVARQVAHAIVYDPKEKKYLIIRNKKHNWDTVVIGGIEEMESPEETARREVREETGYTDLNFKMTLGGPVETHYFAKHKNENRIAYARASYFELASDARVPIAEGEDADNEILWVSEDDFVPGKMVNSELPIWLERLNARVEVDPKTNIPCFIDWGNTSAVKPDLPFIERNAIAAVVKHWSEDKYIGLKWKQVAWRTIITGGAEGNQTNEEGAIQEIIEETGYQHPKLIRHLGHADSKFFHNPKNINRYAHFDTMYFELTDGERRELTADEQFKHEVVWLTKEEMSDFLNNATQRYMWDILFLEKPNRFIPGKPLLDWPESIKEAQRNWIGRSEGAQIDFRLTLSAQKKPRFVIIHGFEGSSKRNFIPWLKAELEKRGHYVETPELPNAFDPNEKEQVEYVLKRCTFNENTVVIGHSLGAIVAMKALMELNKPISGLVLVAAAVDPKFFNGKEDSRKYAERFSWDFDFEKIRERAQNRIAVLSDIREPKRAPYLKFLSEKLHSRLVECTSTEEHFCAAQEPEVLKAVTLTVPVFTTRPDTLFGVTYLVFAPEHPWVKGLLEHVTNRADVEAYIATAARETEIERTDVSKEKTGVELKGVKAINPATNEEVPVWIADYVLSDYGTGAVMAVPAHDERDGAFAKKFGLPIRNVIAPEFNERHEVAEKTDGSAVIAFDPAIQKYACLHWQNPDRYTIVTGGRAGDESYEDTARRELGEEAGITKVSAWHKLGERLFAHYFNASKNVYKAAISVQFLAVVDSHDVGTTKREAHENFDLEWKGAEEILSLFREKLPKSLHFPEILARAVFKLKDLGLDTTTDISLFSFIKAVPFTEPGILINSGSFDGLESEAAKKQITESVGGSWVTKYKLRDWVFSRQRYWGEPIPVIHCGKCGVVAVPEKDLPVKLPKVKSYEPTGTGESPLAAISSWVNVKCPTCKGPAKRETNTMPQWAGSSWYYLRYMDPNNSKKLVDLKREKYWAPVDLYVGGAEHATRHLIYARFWHKFLLDIGSVTTAEPFHKLQSVGLIMGEDGRKMSKRFGNVINPDDIVARFGADTLRIYEMFMGPFDQMIAWSTDSMVGSRRFIERVWKLGERIAAASDSGASRGGKGSGRIAVLGQNLSQNANTVGTETPATAPASSATAALANSMNATPISRIINRAIKKVTEDIDQMRFNTAISTLMITVNELEKAPDVSRADYETLLKLMAPFAPHATEELWTSLGNKKSIHLSSWPTYDPAQLADEETTVMVQINGKVRGSFKAITGAGKDELEREARAIPEAKKWLEGKTVAKVIVVPGRLVNIVLTD